ncbi:hypothetical protein KBC75_01310 [Candidatus Shapirobacteria bacterium]|nr:hypothetical protein [Candidatus Shapirobacteria bacterium]
MPKGLPELNPATETRYSHLTVVEVDEVTDGTAKFNSYGLGCDLLGEGCRRLSHVVPITTADGLIVPIARFSSCKKCIEYGINRK